MQSTKQAQTVAPKISLARQTQQLRRNLQTPISAPRIALERKISLKFPHFQGFLTEYCSNVSITGMFIQSQEPRPPGEIIDFEFNLIDGLQLIRGTGEVIWVRLTDEGPQQPAGMGLRFLRLDAESRRLIRWAVEKQISLGGKPFELDAFQAEALALDPVAQDSETQPQTPPRSIRARSKGTGTTVVDAHRRHPYAGYAVAQRTDWRSRLLAVATVLLPIVILAAAVLISYPKTQSQALDTASTETIPAAVTPESAVSESAVSESAVSESAAPEPAASTPTAASAPAPHSELVSSTLAWAQAWANQRPADYLAHYSQRFQPPWSLSRDTWEAQRTERISKPDFIQVDISGLEIELLAPDHAQVTFDQAYRSDNFRDAMRKTLELVREDDGWKILAERAAG